MHDHRSEKMKKINVTHLVFTILMLSMVNSAFAGNWQNPWSLEKVGAEKGCADSYDHRACLQDEKKAYDAMQGEFGASTKQALQTKKRCTKVFHRFSKQLWCMNGVLNREPIDQDIIKACDANGDGMINTRLDWKLGMVSRDIGKKEHKCQLRKEGAKLDAEGAKLDAEGAKKDAKIAKLKAEIIRKLEGKK